MSARLRVLAYHRIAAPGERPDLDPALVSATPEEFERQMRYLARRYRVVDLGRVLEAVRGERSLPRRAVLLTFDDAYRDFGEVAWPVLRRLGLPAVLFVPTGFPDRPGRRFWWDRLHRAVVEASPGRLRSALARRGLVGTAREAGRVPSPLKRRLKEMAHDEAMDEVEQLRRELREGGGRGDGEERERSDVLGWDDLRGLAEEGVAIGAHTRSHPLLTRVPPEAARREILGSKRDLARELSRSPAAFCYPGGYHDDRVVRMVAEADYEVAFTMLDGHNRPSGTDPLRLRRTGVTRRTSLPVLKLRLRSWFSPVDRWRHRGDRARQVG